MATMNALTWDDREHTISERCTSTVYADTVESSMPVLTTAAVLQNCGAHSRAHAVAEGFGGHAAASNHPTSGARPDMDDLLNSPAQLIATQGQAPSKFAGELMERLTVSGSPLLALSSMTNGDSSGLTAELPFSGPRPVAAIAAATEPAETALLQVLADAPHPQFGSGALIILRLPLKFSPADATHAANALNLWEGTTKTGTTLLGAWCLEPGSDTSLAFVSFVPSMLARGGVLENFCIHNAFRTRWAHGMLSPDATAQDMRAS
jgi:hypothetical protein